MKLICKANGKILRVGSTVNYDGDKCTIVDIKGTNIELERINDGVSWSMIEPDDFGALWDEAQFVEHFFNTRELELAA